MKKIFIAFASILAFSNSLTFFHKQHKVLDCGKGIDIKSPPGCLNIQNQSQCSKKVINDTCCPKNCGCPNTCYKNKVVIQEGCFNKKLNFQAPCVPEIIPSKNIQCQEFKVQKQIIKSGPGFNLQYQAPSKKC